MSLSTLLVLITLGLFLLILVIFPDFRRKLKTLIGGLLGVFIEDVAKTPEGAAATYQQAIDEQQEIYQQASDTLRDLAGQHAITVENLKKATDEKNRVEKECEILARKNADNELFIKAQEREAILENIEMQQKAIDKLAPLVADAKEILAITEAQLMKLKKDKNSKVMELKLNNTISDSYDKVDKLKRTTATAKLLGTVDEGVAESKQRAVGSKILHESKLETQVERADRVTKQLSTASYVDELKKKYTTNSN